MSWKKVNSRSQLPNKAGLYAIYQKDNNKLLYIGKSTNIQTRFFNQNCTDKHRDIIYFVGRDNIYIKYKITEYLFTEKHLIEKLKPPYNDYHNSNKHQQRVARKRKVVLF